MARKALPPTEYLRECLRYDPATGILWWRERPREHFKNTQAWPSWNTRFAGKPAGNHIRTGYSYIPFEGAQYLAHRLCWALHYDTAVPDEIDHINGNPRDNRIENLRAATHSRNGANRKGASKNSKTGILGVSPLAEGGFIAVVMSNGVQYRKAFRTLAEAIEARREAAARMHGEFARD